LVRRTGIYLEESDVCSHLFGRKIEKKRHELTFGIPGLGIFNPFMTSGTYMSRWSWKG